LSHPVCPMGTPVVITKHTTRHIIAFDLRIANNNNDDDDDDDNYVFSARRHGNRNEKRNFFFLTAEGKPVFGRETRYTTVCSRSGFVFFSY